MPADSRRIVRRWFQDVWNKGNWAVADQIVAANYVNHDPAAPMSGAGLDGFKQHVTRYRTAFPDLQITVDDIVAMGNKVTVRWTARGTHKGELLGNPPTGKKTTTTGISLLRVIHGKVAEHWVNWDTLGMMRELGAIAEPAKPVGKAAGQ